MKNTGVADKDKTMHKFHDPEFKQYLDECMKYTCPIPMYDHFKRKWAVWKKNNGIKE